MIILMKFTFDRYLSGRFYQLSSVHSFSSFYVGHWRFGAESSSLSILMNAGMIVFLNLKRAVIVSLLVLPKVCYGMSKFVWTTYFVQLTLLDIGIPSVCHMFECFFIVSMSSLVYIVLLVPYSIVRLLDISGIVLPFEATVFGFVCWFSLGMTISVFSIFVLMIGQASLTFFFSTIPSVFWTQYSMPVLPQQGPEGAWNLSTLQNVFGILLTPLRRVGNLKSVSIAALTSPLIDLFDKTWLWWALSPSSIPFHCIWIRVWQPI